MALGNKYTSTEILFELCYNASNTVKREVQEKVRVGPRTPRGFRSAREEEEEGRCTRLCLTDVDTFSVSVKGKRKFASRRAVLTATCVQLLPLMSGYFSDVGFSCVHSFLFNTYATLIHEGTRGCTVVT